MKPIKTILATALTLGIIGVVLTIHDAQAQDPQCIHTTVAGDSYAGIAAKYSIEVWELQDLNIANYPVNGALQTGWDLVVPCVGGAAPAQPDTDQPTSTEEIDGEPVTVSVFFDVDTEIKAGPGETFATLDIRFANENIEAQARNQQNTWLM